MVKTTIKARKSKGLKIVDKIYGILATREQKLCMDDVSVQIELEDYLEACVGLNKMGLRKTAEEVATLLGVKSAYLARKKDLFSFQKNKKINKGGEKNAK